MSRIAYVDGRYVSHRLAGVHIEDRGYQFADGAYEVLAVSSGHLVDEARHLARLSRSLAALRIPTPMSDAALDVVTREVIRRNGVIDGIVYLQITRGTAPREHAFPRATEPVLVVTSRRKRPADPRLAEEGVAVITIPDIRWQRCDIKSAALIANVLGKQRAREAGAYEAWQVHREGFVTEGTSTNAWIVTAEDEVVTRAADNAILNGITRLAICDLLRTEGCRLVERPFTVAEAKAAREAFLTRTTTGLLPVVRIDNDSVGNGAPGLLAGRLRALYLAHAAEMQ
jgi:D-alanine transaminase